MRTSFIAILLSLSVGCAAQGGSDDSSGPGPGPGGKADDGQSTTVTLTEMPDEEQAYVRAADVECLHMGKLEVDPYFQQVKLLCLPRGGVAAPIGLYVALTPMGEAGGAYKLYELPTYISDAPENVTITSSTELAAQLTSTIAFTAKQPAGEDLLEYASRTFSVRLALSGDQENPDVVATFTQSE